MPNTLKKLTEDEAEIKTVSFLLSRYSRALVVRPNK